MEILHCENLSPKKVRQLVGTSHSNTLQSLKDRYLESLTRSGSDIRLVIATSALGCGIDIENVYFFIRFAPTYDTVDYVQQIGRAGRNKTHN